MAGLILLLLAGFAAAPGIEVTIEPLEGKSLVGRLAELSAERIVVETASGVQTLSPKHLQSVQLGGLPTSERPSVWVELVDGSLLTGRSLQSGGGKATLETLFGERLDLPPRAIRSLRFQAQSPEIAAQWQELFKVPAGGDLVVLRKTSTREVEEEGKAPKTVTQTVLDQLEGTILEVSPAGAKFDFDGEKIDVKREKMEGIIYFHPAKRELPPAVGRLLALDGSVWSVRTLDLKGGNISLTTPAGVPQSLPLASVSQIDFGVGNILFLTDMEQELVQGEISFQPKNMVSSFKQLTAPRKNRSLSGEPLSIQGVKYHKGINLHSRTRLDVRVPDGYRQFRAVAGIDDTAGPAASFQLRILGDNKELLARKFSADETAGPFEIELDLASVRRLSILVEEGAGQDIADTLILANARLTK